MKRPEVPMTLLWLQNIANASDLAVLVHFSSCIRKGKRQWGFSYVPVEFPIESIALRIAPWSSRMSCLNFVKVCFHPSRIMILPGKTQIKITAKPVQTVLPLEMFCQNIFTLCSLCSNCIWQKLGMDGRYARYGRWWQMMAGTWQGHGRDMAGTKLDSSAFGSNIGGQSWWSWIGCRSLRFRRFPQVRTCKNTIKTPCCDHRLTTDWTRTYVDIQWIHLERSVGQSRTRVLEDFDAVGQNRSDYIKSWGYRL